MNRDITLDSILTMWDDNRGDITGWKSDMLSFYDHPQKKKIVDWIIENSDGMICYSGGCICSELYLETQFDKYMKEVAA